MEKKDILKLVESQIDLIMEVKTAEEALDCGIADLISTWIGIAGIEKACYTEDFSQENPEEMDRVAGKALEYVESLIKISVKTCNEYGINQTRWLYHTYAYCTEWLKREKPQ